jgi:cysteine synthase A
MNSDQGGDWPTDGRVTNIETLGSALSSIIVEDAATLIGETPLVRLERLIREVRLDAEILIKLEYRNPFGSHKDRVARAMVDGLEAEGRIAPERTILIEATTGSLGISLANIAARRGYRLILTMPDLPSLGPVVKLLGHVGARVELTPPELGIQGALDRARELVRAVPGGVTTDQFNNPANAAAHEMTAYEIWRDCGGQIDCLIVGIGTGGTLTGCARYLKNRQPPIQVIGVEPSAAAVIAGDPPGRHGIIGLGPGFIPDVLDISLIDEIVKVPDTLAVEAARLAARMENIAGGLSTGANIAAALTIAARSEMRGRRIVTLAPSPAERYSESMLFDPIDEMDLERGA